MSARRQAPTIAGSLKLGLEAVSKVLSAEPNAGMVIGGIAVIAHGVPRTTRDVDATIDGSRLGLEEILEAFALHEIVPRIDDALQFARETQVLLLRHAPSGMDVDVSIAWLPFELEAIAAAQAVVLGDLRVPMARPEDLLIYKAIAWRPQDQQDVERLLALYGRNVDLERIRRIVAEFAAVLDEPARTIELERVIARALG
jgi:predicted nucleotidyltransferase